MNSSLCSGACVGGYFCTAGSTSPTSQLCPGGAYCPGGAAGAPYLCPAGRFGNTSGVSDSGCSGACMDGYFCPSGTTSPTAYACAVGPAAYCPMVRAVYRFGHRVCVSWAGDFKQVLFLLFARVRVMVWYSFLSVLGVTTSFALEFLVTISVIPLRGYRVRRHRLRYLRGISPALAPPLSVTPLTSPTSCRARSAPTARMACRIRVHQAGSATPLHWRLRCAAARAHRGTTASPTPLRRRSSRAAARTCTVRSAARRPSPLLRGR